jgi:succinate dehydrogenase / fumarate reductase flavoprotein subunit
VPLLESAGNTIATDILIIGGGIAGLTAAISAREASSAVGVLVVDKVVAGWGGKANKGGGNIAYVDPEDSMDAFLEFRVREIGDYLVDQELLRDYAEESRANLERLEGWGVHIFRHPDGRPKYVRWAENLPWRMAVMDQDVTLNLLHHAKKLGVKFLDRVALVDLLTSGGKVTGAIGFSMITGNCILVNSKATMLANGGQNWKLMRRWSNGRGDGIAAAYRAGAVMRNAEFGNFINWIFADTKEVCQGAEDVLYNTKGENISKPVRPAIEADVHSKEVVAWWKEMKKGSGPICANMAENYINNVVAPAFHSDVLAVRPISTAFWGRTIGKAMAAAKSHGPMQEVLPGFIGEQSCVKVDHGMATTLPGLFAIGDTSAAGSAWAGAVPCPPGRMRGSGLANAVFSGVRGGRGAAAYALGNSSLPGVDAGQAETLKEHIYASLKRNAGITAPELVRAVQDIMSPVGYSICKSAARMQEALRRVLAIKARLPELSAPDWHYLAACWEAEAMVLGAEMFYRASLERRESRGWHLREDYPQKDNGRYLQWITLRDQNGNMTVAAENVPIERYPIQP